MNILNNVVILDTETGGLDPLTHSMMTIGLVSGDGEHQLEIWVAEPKIIADPRALAVNRLDPAEVAARGVSPAEACEQVDAFLKTVDPERGRPMVVGHNVAFDNAFMRRMYTMAGRPVNQAFSHRTVDTHTLLWGLIATGKLPPTVNGSDAAFSHFDVAPPEALRHTALGDAVATRDLLEKLLRLLAE
jgi:DNA polymerase III subunit epsilon